MSKTRAGDIESEELDIDVKFTRALREGGFDDFFMLDRETAREVLTEERLRLIDAIDEHRDEISSKSDLSKIVGRDVSAVHRDLDILFENGLIRYEKVGNRRIPKLAYEHIVVEPIR
jgi:DNA-binding transcriptional ArsR family regulator